MIQFITNRFNNLIVPLLIGIGSFVLGLFLIKYIVMLIKARIHNKYGSIEENPYSKKIANMVGQMVYIVLMIFNILIACQIVGLNVGILMAGISFGVGFAMQTTLANMVSGVMLITNPRFKAGSSVTLLDGKPKFVKIEKVGVRSTIFRQLDGTRLILPNKKLTQTPMKVLGDGFIRCVLSVSIVLEADIQFAKQLIRDAVNENKNVVQKELTYVSVKSVDTKGTTLDVYYYIQKGGKKPPFVIKSDLIKTIVNVLRKNNISIPYPTQTISI